MILITTWGQPVTATRCPHQNITCICDGSRGSLFSSIASHIPYLQLNLIRGKVYKAQHDIIAYPCSTKISGEDPAIDAVGRTYAKHENRSFYTQFHHRTTWPLVEVTSTWGFQGLGCTKWRGNQLDPTGQPWGGREGSYGGSRGEWSLFPT